MVNRCIIGAATLVASLVASLGAATVSGLAHDEAKYPNLKGAWVRADQGQTMPWDPSKPAGRGQQAPLTPEYQALYDTALARQAAGINVSSCLPPGMPRSMIAPEPMEIIVMPDTTYIMLTYMSEFRRIYTDGRKYTDEVEAAFSGFSVGTWQDTDGDGRFDTLVVETRGLKGPRTFDDSGIPLHKDNQTVVKERIYLDKSDPDLLHNEITTTDNALTRPWTVMRSYRRDRNVEWVEHLCADNNQYVTLGEEVYSIGGDGVLSPTRKDQPPPDLRYFTPSR